MARQVGWSLSSRGISFGCIVPFSLISGARKWNHCPGIILWLTVRRFTGINAMVYYIVYIFQMAGLTENTTLTAASIQYILMVAMTIPSLLWADKWPRRQTMMVGSFSLTVFLFTESALMAVYGHAVPEGVNGVKTVSWVVDGAVPSRAIIACSYLFVVFFAPTWG